MVENGTFHQRTQKLALANQITLLVYENHANPTVQVSGALSAGAFFDPKDKPGLSRITASMLKRGTQRKNKLEIAQTLEDVGAGLSIYANRFQVMIDGQALSKDAKNLLRILAEVLREPVFPGDELERLKQQMIGRLKRQQEDTSARAYERFTQLVYDENNPFYRHPVETLIASIQSLDEETIGQFYSRYYGAGSLTLVIVGDVDGQLIAQQVGEIFGDWPTGPREGIRIDRTRPQPGMRRDIVAMKDKANVDVLLGHAGQLRRTDADYYAAYIGNAALGQSTLSSRLGLRVRDREGLTYGIVSRFFEPGIADGPWAVSLTVNPENADKTIGLTLDIVRSYVEEGITDKELEDEKSSFKGSFIVGLGTNAGLATHLLTVEILGLGPEHLDELPQLVASVSRQQVNAAIRRYIQPDCLVTVMAGECQPAEK